MPGAVALVGHGDRIQVEAVGLATAWPRRAPSRGVALRHLLQGVLIARVRGPSLPEFLVARLFEPLGMTDSAFAVAASERDRFTSSHLTFNGAAAVDSWNVPGRYGWVSGTGTTAHLTPSTGAVAILHPGGRDRTCRTRGDARLLAPRRRR
jgi:CubicO group peptidase (beta-lactamase class C family)